MGAASRDETAAPAVAVRFYLDENLSARVAEIARSLGLDVTSSAECGNSGLSDDDQLRYAAGEGRCLVSADRGFVAHTVRFFERGLPHSGVLIVPRSMPTDEHARIARALAEYARAHGDGPTDYLLDYLQ